MPRHPPAPDLTPRQQAVLDFIRRCVRKEGMPPTLQQIADAFGFAQPCAALKHVRRLEAAGCLEVRTREARGIRLRDQGGAFAFGTGSGLGQRSHDAQSASDATEAAQRNRKLRGHQAPSTDLLTLPVLGRVAAGQPIGADAAVHRVLQLDAALFSRKPDYLLRVQGDSMIEEGILDGDLVAVKRGNTARDGQVVVARLEGELTIKRLELGAKRIRLLPRNPAHAPIVVRRGDDFAIEGVFCGLVRDA